MNRTKLELLNEECSQTDAQSKLECLYEITRAMSDVLVECRNELAEIRGWDDGYVLNASDSLTCFDIYCKNTSPSI